MSSVEATTVSSCDDNPCIEAKTQISNEEGEEGGKLVSPAQAVDPPNPNPNPDPKGVVKVVKMEVEDSELDPRKQQWSESLKARLFGSSDKDGNYFSFMFLDKIFGETRPCVHCGARGSAKVPPGDNSLQLFVIEEGIVGCQNIMCEKCGGRELVVSGDDPSLLPQQDPRLVIKGAEIREYCKKITHYEVLHDLMEMLHIAAMDDGTSRKEKHSEVAAFMLHNARKICEEWCRPEHAELRLRKYLRLREETLLTKYKPTFTPDCTEEFKEMYEMMAQSFRQNHGSILTLLQLLKESLIDNPSRSTFMTWLSMSMMHSESYPQFKRLYDPRSFMRVESTEYQAIHDRYLSLDVPVGIKKIPVIFVLFEIPRFYHYVDFLNRRLSKRKPRSFLTEEERAELKAIEEDAAKSGVGKAAKRRGKKTKTMVSPEAHFDFLTQQEDIDRERVYQSCRDKKAKSTTELEHRERGEFPKAIQSAPQKDTPPDTVPAQRGAGVAGETGLTKAQLKRRKKRAVAASVKMMDGDGGNKAAVTKVTSAKEVPVAATKAKATKATVTKDKVNKVKTKAAVTKDKAVVTKAAVTKDELVAKDTAMVTKAVAVPEKATLAEDYSDDDATPVDLSVERTEVLDTLVKNINFDALRMKMVEMSDTKEKSLESGTPEPPVFEYSTQDETYLYPGFQRPDVARLDRAAMEGSFLQGMRASPFAPYLPESDRIDLVRELTLVSYPVVADMMEYANSLAEPLPERWPAGKPKMVSMLFDPFSLYKEDDVPTHGVTVFIKAKNNVRLPSEVKIFNFQKVPDSEDGTLDDVLKSVEVLPYNATPTDVVPTLPKSADVAAPFSRTTDFLDPPESSATPTTTTTTTAADSSVSVPPKATDLPLPAPPPPTTSSDLQLVSRKPDKAQQNIQDPLQARLARLIAESLHEEEEETVDEDAEDEDDGAMLNLDYLSIESTHLPLSLRRVIERDRGEALEAVAISQADYMAVMREMRKRGVSHADVRHRDVETAFCYPAALRLDECVVELLSKGLEDDPGIAMLLNRMDERDRAKRRQDKAQIRKEKARGSLKSSSYAGETPDSDPLPDLPDLPDLPGKASDAKPPPVKAPDTKPLAGFKTPEPVGRNASRRAKREALKTAKKTLKNPTDHQAIMVTQMNTEVLRRQGYKVDTQYPQATVVANRNGAIIHVLDGQQTPEQVRDFLATRYNIIAQQAGPGYVTMPTKDHPGGLLVDPKLAANEDIPTDKFSGNRKKLRSKKKAIQEKQCSSLTRWPVPQPRNPYSIPLGQWATKDAPWPEGLDFGTEYHSDREIVCESDDEELVKSIDHDDFGNHSMLMRLELSSVDVPNEEAAETVMNRYMEPADLGPGIDPKVPRYIIPSNGVTPHTSKKLPAGTTKEDLPFIMMFAAPHKQMRAMDAMKIPYKFELTQVLTPHLNKEGEEVPDAPKRIALMSKITLLPKSRYRSLNPEPEEEVKEDDGKEDESLPKISKSQRKKLKKKLKLAEGAQYQDPSFLPSSSFENRDPLDPSDELVRSKLDDPDDEGSGTMDSTDDDESLEGAVLSTYQAPASRAKLRFCDNCGQEILTRVQVCAGCKKVAYCNFRCQKASWKQHKKTCSYALRKEGKESTG